jgi:hypothetical protein
MPKKKTCARCKRKRLARFFNKHAQDSSGLQPYCKECSNEAGRESARKGAKKIAQVNAALARANGDGDGDVDDNLALFVRAAAINMRRLGIWRITIDPVRDTATVERVERQEIQL